MHQHCLVLSLFVVALPARFAAQDAGSAGSADTEAQGTAYDLRVELRPDLALLGELRLGMQYAIEASSGSKRKKLEFEYESRLDFVDEVLARDQPEAGDLDVRRTYLLWQEDGTDERGKMRPQDNALGGAQALITLRRSELGLELINRLAPQKDLEGLLKHSESVTWLKLPASARVGETFEVEPAGLVNLLLSGDFIVQSARGTFTLRSVDEQGVASFDGPLLVIADDAQGEGRGTFEGTCTLSFDTREKRVQGVQWKGEARLLMDDGQARAEGQGTFDSRLSVTAGAPARKALGRKTTYRAVPRSLEKAPVALELPSHWYSVEGEEAETFRTTVHGHESPVTLEFQAFAVSTEEFDSVVGAAVAEMEKDVRLSNQRNVTSPLGKGRSMRFQTKADDGKTVYGALVEFYPCGKSQLLRVRLIGPSDAFEQELGDWPGILRTLELNS